MKSNLEEIRNRARSLMSSKDYKGALSLIDSSEKGHKDGTLLMIGADCSYELNDDVGALKKFLEYVRKFPAGKAREFALFNAALCLKNIGLYKEADRVLQDISKTHPGLFDEINENAEILEKMTRAQDIVAQYYGKNKGSSEQAPRH